MSRNWPVLALLLCSTLGALAQSSSRKSPSNPPPPRSDEASASSGSRSAEESSSKDRDVDIRPPKDDAKNHPYSGAAVADAMGEDVQELHPWDPHRAAKDVEVGDFYFKRKNYPAAEARYRDALVYKPNDALASFGLAQTLERLGKDDEARQNYEAYLKILPEGPLAAEAHKALDRIANKESDRKN